VLSEGQVGGEVRGAERVVRARDPGVPATHALALAPPHGIVQGGQPVTEVAQAAAVRG
jgi:hypothetical protein